MFDQFKALTQLGPMMAKFRDMQNRLPSVTASGSAGGSLVTAVANGSFEIVALTYNTTAPLTDPELLADLTRAAVNQALKNVKDALEKEMAEVAGGLDPAIMRQMLGQ
jgi:DNA-binding protein YbaB